MSFMEDTIYQCTHCGQKVDTSKITERHDCYMMHIHKVLEAKNNNKRKKSNGTRRIRNRN
jgi:hypothetical protein